MSIPELLQQRQTKFIETRAIIEREIDTFMTSVNSIDQKYFEGLQRPVGNTAREIVPSLWVEPFNMETYTTEINAFLAFEQQVRNIADRNNQEALQCLQQSVS